MNSCGKVSMHPHMEQADHLTYLSEGNGWSEGANNQHPTDPSGISSFDALDAAITYFADKDEFPLIEDIVLAGHSAGGQIK